jgi:hypothetical protein
MLLDAASEKLGWPHRDQIFQPKGAGPAVAARLADRKLGEALRRLWPNVGLRIGVLVSNSYADESNAPLAIICEFNRPVQDEAIFLEAQRIGWHLCRSRALLTVEPHLLRSWTCCEPPLKAAEGSLYWSPEITEARLQFEPESASFISQNAADALHWVELVSDRFFEKHQDRFPRDKCADQMLVENLKFVRAKLRTAGGTRLPDHMIHDLLARTIFTQFLSQRKDSGGESALNQSYLEGLFAKGVLSQKYAGFEEVLLKHADTYALFRHLNEHFNGDLFPGKDPTPDEQEAEWQAEMAAVKPGHLELLSEFVGGKLEMPTGQGLLWPEYLFDIIPLELISCIYEEFVDDPTGTQRGVHYTPPHIVDFILDGELPWSGDTWDLRIIDPACGSGIFLVKAFQRLIHRWRNANGNEEPRAELLRRLLEKNIFGVDIHEEAVRVASFSLYLAMCDEIEPRHYWQQVRFPRLRGKNLVHSDFFNEDRVGFRTKEDAEGFDLVVGNAPWGKATATEAARIWARDHDWGRGLPNDNVGPLFLAKAACLTRPEGAVSLLQPASALLFNRSSTTLAFRKKLFERLKVTEVVNLSVLRFGIFARSISPCCAVTLRPIPPDDEPLRYITPKGTQSSDESFGVIIETQDVQMVYPDEAANEPWVWTALAWGSRRDLSFLKGLGRERNLRNLKKDGIVKAREGFIRGDRTRKEEGILGRPVLEANDFPESTFLYLDAYALPRNEDPEVHSRDSTDYAAFELHQLILKQGWQTATQRIRAAVTRSDKELGGVLCSQSYVSIHVDPASNASELLESACLSYNSIFAVYFFYLTSGRLASYRPELQVGELLSLPFPKAKSGLIRGLETLSDVDECIRVAFALKEAEWMAVKDFFYVTLRDFKGGEDSSGRLPTRRSGAGRNGEEPELKDYCKHFLRVLKAGFGQDKAVCATVFHETNGSHLPLRMVAIHLDWPERAAVSIETEECSILRRRLANVFREALRPPDASAQGVYYQRTARLYETIETEGSRVPTIYIVKPDRVRYWTGSSGVRDADVVSADLMRWGQMSEPQSIPQK